MNYRVLTGILSTALFTVSCLGPGDELDCPVCDDATELLVGTKCVPFDEVAECGPDGHTHGTECHCFSGQQPTTIGAKDYCLQQGCSGAADTDAQTGDANGIEDLDRHACEHLGDTPEDVTAVTAFDDFEDAHADLEHLAHVDLPAGTGSFVHFPGDETGEVAVFLDETGVIDGFLDAGQNALPAEKVGANTDCPDDFVEVWHVEVTNDTGSPTPQIIRFKADVADHVHVLILEIGHEHEE